MVEVLSQTSPNPADTTIIAVIDALLVVVVPQLADITVIPCRSFTTISAVFAGWLRIATPHA
jgi:hypothetical protein